MSPGRILLTEAQIARRVQQLARDISRHYRGRPVHLLGVMNGALFFLADLLRASDLPGAEIGCVRLASYAGTKSTRQVRGLARLGGPFRGRDVLIVDDILDTGHTLSALAQRLKKLGATDVKICVLLEKKRKREARVRADWVGFHITDRFVVGYGLDHDGRHRTLRNVHVLSHPSS